MMVALLTVDLAVISRVDGAARMRGYATRSASSVAAAVELCRSESPALLIVDLSTSALDPSKLVSQIKTLPEPPRIVAFGPHVHTDKLSAAEAAGCDVVLSRGQFFSQLDRLLTE